MAERIEVFLNFTRNILLSMRPAVQKAMAKQEVKIFLVPRILGHGIVLGRRVLDTSPPSAPVSDLIPDALVSDEMAERYLEIRPPVISLIPDYQSIVNEIEQSYVIGNDFSALSASCVVIERLLNQARIALHKHHRDKVIKNLWDKDSTNEWYPNIDALRKWGYLDDAFASELSDIYREVRCRYLHCGKIQSLRDDARRVVVAAYRLMTTFIGFPEDLFLWKGGSPACKNVNDPRFLEFYKPYIQHDQSTCDSK